jgi:hypothetical protein
MSASWTYDEIYGWKTEGERLEIWPVAAFPSTRGQTEYAYETGPWDV